MPRLTETEVIYTRVEHDAMLKIIQRLQRQTHEFQPESHHKIKNLVLAGSRFKIGVCDAMIAILEAMLGPEIAAANRRLQNPEGNA